MLEKLMTCKSGAQTLAGSKFSNMQMNISATLKIRNVLTLLQAEM
jgi:hypothetical protein